MVTPLDRISDFPALVDYLREELEWPIVEADFEKLTFSYSPEEVGLDSAKVGGGIEILQLRPLPRRPRTHDSVHAELRLVGHAEH